MYFRVMLSVLGVLMCAGIVHAAPFAYIANNADNTVSVLDTASNQVTAVINVGQGPFGVAVSGMGGRVYVSNQNDNTISVIDTTDNSVTSIPLTVQPGALAVNSAGTRLFVANPAADTVSIFNTITKQPDTTPTVALSVDCQPQGIAAGPADGSGNYNVYVACGSGQIDIINATASSYEKSATEVGLTNILPQGIAVSKDGKRVYVVGSQSVALLETASLGSTPTTVLTDAAFSWLIGIAADPTVANSDAPNAIKLYVTDSAIDKVHVVTATGNALAYSTSLTAGSGPWGVAYTGDGAKAVTSNFNFGTLTPGTVTVVESSNNAVTTTDGGPAQFIGRAPKSFGNFAGPNFINITASVPDHTCGEITTSELITPTGTPASYIYRTALGKDITFAITTKENCSPSSVTIDGGNSIGTPPSYTFDAPVADHTLEANFTRNAYKVVVTKTGSGTGVVDSRKYISNQWTADGIINCGSTCSGSDAVNNTVTLFSTPAGDSELFGWTGSGCSGTTACQLVLNEQTALAFASNGVFYVNAEYRIKASGPIRAGRPGAPSYKMLLQDAYNSLNAGSISNPLDINTSMEYTLVADQNVNAVLVGGWTEWTTNGYGSIPADSASVITGGLRIDRGSITIGSCDSATYLACVGSGAIIVK